jgi:hypothetical protein
MSLLEGVEIVRIRPLIEEVIQETFLMLRLVGNTAVQRDKAFGMSEPACMHLVALVDEILDIGLYPPNGIADKSYPHVRIKAGQGLNKTHVSLLNYLERTIAKVKIRLADFHHKTQVRGDNLLACIYVAMPVLSSEILFFFWSKEGIVLNLPGIVLKIRRRISTSHRPSRKIGYYILVDILHKSQEECSVKEILMKKHNK